MKKIWCFLCLSLLLMAGICAAQVPDILGNWSCTWSGYDDGKEYVPQMENGNFTFDFKEQNGRSFAGTLRFTEDSGKENSIDFVGAFGPDNKTLYLAQFDQGYAVGTVISSDEMEMIYLKDGANASADIDQLHRTKAAEDK